MSTKSPFTAATVFANVQSTGPRSSLTSVAVHEFPMMKRMAQIVAAEDITLDPSWVTGVNRVRFYKTPDDVRSELSRLQGLYTTVYNGREIDLITEFYGAEQNGLIGFMKALKRIHLTYRELRETKSDLQLTENDLHKLVNQIVEDPFAAGDQIPMDASELELTPEEEEQVAALDRHKLQTFLVDAGLAANTATAVAGLVAQVDGKSDQLSEEQLDDIEQLRGNENAQKAVLHLVHDYLKAEDAVETA